MTEEFLQYIWKFRMLSRDLKTTGGEEVVILHPGEQNHDSGPDFLNARVRIGETLWAGNVEVHVNESDWLRHNHHLDHAYDNVILHVVYNDEKRKEPPGEADMPLLVIRELFQENLFSRYEAMIQSTSKIPCEKLVMKVDPVYFGEWASSLVVEKLTERCDQWERLLEANHYDWAETLHQVLASVFGLRVNCLPFELLAKALPLKLVLKHRENLFSLEALAFGQAGMLGKEFPEPYPNRLKEEYNHLAAKYSLTPIDHSIWKFLRLRPSSFPTVRIAQWAAVLQHADRFFSLITEKETPDEIMQFFSITASEYWDSHFIFGKLSPSCKKTTGIPTINLFALNAVAPFLFFYGHYKGQEEHRERALRWIAELPGEENHVVARWKELGFPADNALFTQALLRLKLSYCDKRRCLECRVGMKVICERLEDRR